MQHVTTTITLNQALDQSKFKVRSSDLVPFGAKVLARNAQPVENEGHLENSMVEGVYLGVSREVFGASKVGVIDINGAIEDITDFTTVKVVKNGDKSIFPKLTTVKTAADEVWNDVKTAKCQACGKNRSVRAKDTEKWFGQGLIFRCDMTIEGKCENPEDPSRVYKGKRGRRKKEWLANVAECSHGVVNDPKVIRSNIDQLKECLLQHPAEKAVEDDLLSQWIAFRCVACVARKLTKAERESEPARASRSKGIKKVMGYLTFSGPFERRSIPVPKMGGRQPTLSSCALLNYIKNEEEVDPTKWLFKGRLVCLGDSVVGLHDDVPLKNPWGDLWAPSCSLRSLRIILSWALRCGYPFLGIDVENAYLQCSFPASEPPHYCTLPDSAIEAMSATTQLKCRKMRSPCFRMDKCLYGHPASGKAFVDEAISWLVKKGWSQLDGEPGLLTRGDDLCIINVDDILCIGPGAQRMFSEFRERFQFADADVVKKFLGMELVTHEGGKDGKSPWRRVDIDMTQYATLLVSKYVTVRACTRGDSGRFAHFSRVVRLKLSLIKDCIQRNLMKVLKVRTQECKADPMTQTLGKLKMEEARRWFQLSRDEAFTLERAKGETEGGGYGCETGEGQHTSSPKTALKPLVAFVFDPLQDFSNVTAFTAFSGASYASLINMIRHKYGAVNVNVDVAAEEVGDRESNPVPSARKAGPYQLD